MTQKTIYLNTPIMRLAHPLRCAAEPTGAFKMLADFLGPVICANMSNAFIEDELTSNIAVKLLEDPANARLKQLLYTANLNGSGTEVGNSYAALAYLRQSMYPQPYFVIDDALVEMLENTDIVNDIPVSVLQMPFARFYVEFGKNRDSNLRLPNIQSGSHILEGCYCEKGVNGVLGEGIFVLLTASPLGKSGPLDDATHSIFIPIDDPDRSIKDALDITFKKGQALSKKNGLNLTPVEFLDDVLADVMFLVKVLLYIGLPEARREQHNDKTNWFKASSALKSNAKKAKAAKRGNGLVDHILISATIAATTAQGATGKSVKSHWRRGHYRMQAHGVQRALRKVLFIKPTLVHGENDNAITNVPRYKVV
jgi:hypothetical protein